MKKITQTLVVVFLAVALFSTANGQASLESDQYFNVTPGNGNGLRFWSNNNYKIHMGNTNAYKYGPVRDYSIKMNMNNDSDRGWTWGVYTRRPIAALNTQGTLQLAKDLSVMGKAGIGTAGPNSRLHVNASAGQTGLRIQINGSSKLTVGANGGTTIGAFDDTPPPNGLYVNGRVGIGIANPSYKLHVSDRIKLSGGSAGMWVESGATDWFVGRSGSNLRFFNNGADRVTIKTNGNVGIGITNPAFKLHVNNRVKIDGGSAGMWIEAGNPDWFIGRNGKKLRIWRGGDWVTFLPNGNVGIGCTNPRVKLAVNGEIKARKLTITNGPCSDFVFEPDYKLMDLGELEDFVTNNKHLPEVPSAQEFSEKGYDVRDMDDILLRKVEELTLYIIKQQNELIKQQKEIEELKSKLN